MNRRPLRRGRLRLVRGTSTGDAASTAPAALTRSAAASLLLPGLGQVMQGRWRAGACQLLATAGFYLVASHRPWPTSVQLGLFCACTAWSVADAVRAERVARRGPLRLV